MTDTTTLDLTLPTPTLLLKIRRVLDSRADSGMQPGNPKLPDVIRLRAAADLVNAAREVLLGNVDAADHSIKVANARRESL